MPFTHARSVCTASILVKSRAPRHTNIRLVAILNVGRSAATRNANARARIRVRRVNNHARGKRFCFDPSCFVLCF